MITHGEDVEPHALRAQGWSISAIGRHLGLDRKTVRAHLAGEREVGVRRSSASPQRLTAVFTVCHTQPSSPATSLSGRPRPAWRVAHRAARDVRSARGGAISAACSVTEPASQPSRGQHHRRLCHACLTVGRQHRRGWLTCALPRQVDGGFWCECLLAGVPAR